MGCFWNYRGRSPSLRTSNVVSTERDFDCIRGAVACQSPRLTYLDAARAPDGRSLCGYLGIVQNGTPGAKMNRPWQKHKLVHIPTPLLRKTLTPADKVNPAHWPSAPTAPPTVLTSSNLLSRNRRVSEKDGDLSLVMKSSVVL